MARVLGVSEAGYHAWRQRQPSVRAVADAALLKQIRTAHAGSGEVYGAPRVHATLAAQGARHGRKRIARLMREAGLVGVSRRRGGVVTTRRDREARPAVDLVDRNFSAEAPNQLWVRRHHLRADRRRLPLPRRGDRCLEPARRGLVDGQPPPDRTRARRAGDGRHATPTARRDPPLRPGIAIYVTGLRSRYREAGVRPSMGSVGDAYDNAMCESFFATLECELLDRRRFASQAQARMAVFTLIEGFYNPVRLHSALGYRSPIRYEQERQADP